MYALPSDVWLLIVQRLNLSDVYNCCTINRWFATHINRCITVVEYDRIQNKLTGEILQRLCYLTSLDCRNNNAINDATIRHMTQMLSLTIDYNDKVTNACIAGMSLVTLSLNSNCVITDILHMTRLTSLCLIRTNLITDAGIPLSLTELDLRCNEQITDACIQKLSALTSLNIGSYNLITQQGLHCIGSQLMTLQLSHNRVIDDSCISTLTQLTSLHVGMDMTNAGISNLTQLRILNLGYNRNITAITHLLRLTSLDLSGNKIVTTETLQQMTNLLVLYLRNNEKITSLSQLSLTTLDLTYNHNITDIKHMTRLTTLNLSGNYKITNAEINHLSMLANLNLYQNPVIIEAHISHRVKVIRSIV